uniref:2-cysteine adaptor domain protein n=1 Tax=Siphoviridae sp. ctx254 TaxID=2825737 RepID=A0A8S5TVK8_9CAUD|nr:MAG TPA: 2-cysteine adaptor domain protein [Siphoviridae sp. ctx254]
MLSLKSSVKPGFFFWKSYSRLNRFVRAVNPFTGRKIKYSTHSTVFYSTILLSLRRILTCLE